MKPGDSLSPWDRYQHNDALSCVMAYLDTASLTRMAMVNRQAREVSRADRHWEGHGVRWFGAWFGTYRLQAHQFPLLDQLFCSFRDLRTAPPHAEIPVCTDVTVYRDARERFVQVWKACRLTREWSRRAHLASVDERNKKAWITHQLTFFTNQFLPCTWFVAAVAHLLLWLSDERVASLFAWRMWSIWVIVSFMFHSIFYTTLITSSIITDWLGEGIMMHDMKIVAVRAFYRMMENNGAPFQRMRYACVWLCSCGVIALSLVWSLSETSVVLLNCFRCVSFLALASMTRNLWNTLGSCIKVYLPEFCSGRVAIQLVSFLGIFSLVIASVGSVHTWIVSDGAAVWITALSRSILLLAMLFSWRKKQKHDDDDDDEEEEDEGRAFERGQPPYYADDFHDPLHPRPCRIPPRLPSLLLLHTKPLSQRVPLIFSVNSHELSDW